jgi:hypothetical protein
MAANHTQADASPAQATRREPAGRARAPARSKEPLLKAPPPPELIEGPQREDIIRRRAFNLFEREGYVHGHALDHWLAAESELDRLIVDGLAAVADPA